MITHQQADLLLVTWQKLRLCSEALELMLTVPIITPYLQRRTLNQLARCDQISASVSELLTMYHKQ